MILGKIKLGRFSAGIAILFSFLFTWQACSDDESAGFSADFAYEFKNDNKVRFTNTSEGEYYSLQWNFGNGKELTTTDRTAYQDVYYPQAGEYTVTLKVLNYSGDTKTAEQTITVAENSYELSFSAVPDAQKPNYITLTNTSQGTFDSFAWKFNNNTIENKNTTVAYLPLAGTYEIILQVKIGDQYFTTSQSIEITADDPNYSNEYQLVWADEFDSSINTDNWTFETGAGGWGNNELQNYTAGGNAEIVDGKLVITAKKIDDNKVAGSYTSARMVSKGKKEFTYGKIEVRAKLPSGTGIWPAIWMLGGNISTTGWPACGEIDIMEYVGYEPNVVHSTVHTPSGSGTNGNGSSKTLTTAEEEFHIYGLIWEEDKLVFYTDSPENVTHTYKPAVRDANTWPFDKPQFFILNVAVGGNWGGAQGVDNSIFPQQMEVDYIHVYQRNN